MIEKLQNLLKNSYSPYSHFLVSAIVIMKDGCEFCGVNVENASYGASICAERSAIVSAISDGYKKNAIDYMKLKNDIRLVLEKNQSKEIVQIDIKAFVSDMLGLLQENAITLPRKITMLIRGIVVLEGTLEEVCPDISLLEVLKSRFDYSKVMTKERIHHFAYQSLRSGEGLMFLPNELLTTLKGINSGELRFNIELNDSKHQIDRIERIVHLIIITVLDVAFIIGTSQIVVKIDEELPFIFYVYLFGAIICTLWLLYKLILSKFHRY